MSKVLYVNKPKGMSSFDVCYKLRKVLNTKKIGHTGTLDPNATGVMIILYDSSTKAAQFLVSDYKEYKCKVLFGIETDTLDIDGNIIKKQYYNVPREERIIDVLESFLGKSKQIIPITSAKKIAGKKLYQYQLEGKEIKAPEIDIEIKEIRFEKMFDNGFSFSCNVSSGTYIRSLVRDILSKLDLIGTVEELCRTKINNIDIKDCDRLEDILDGNFKQYDLLDVLSQRYKTIEFNDIETIKNGKRIKLNCNEEMILLVHNNEVLAIYKKDKDEYKCVRGLW